MAAEVIHLFDNDEMVYECQCGSTDFWIKGSADFSCFEGLICQGCDALYEFKEPVKRSEILLYDTVED